MKKYNLHNSKTDKEFHGQAYKPHIEKYFYGERYKCYICGKDLGQYPNEIRDMNYCSRCGNEIDWTGIKK